MKRILLAHQLYYPFMEMPKDRATDEARANFRKALMSGVSGRSAMVYVHIPFCNSHCSFCGFDKWYDLSQAERYVDTLAEEMDYYATKPYIQALDINGVHIGGGTPSLMDDRLLTRVIDLVRDKFDASEAPVNVECSATTLEDSTIDTLIENNVSRVSMGVQSFNEEERRQLKIKATLEETLSAIERLRKKGVTTFIDIMYGFPYSGVSNEVRRVEADIQKAIELDVDGIDFGQYYPFYNPLAMKIGRESLSFPSSNEILEVIERATDMLEAAGYVQETEYVFRKKGNILLEYNYFAKDGRVSDCIGIGSKSAGLIGGFKYRNVPYGVYVGGSKPDYTQIKELTQGEIERIPIVGFPKLLRLDMETLSVTQRKEFDSKFDQLEADGLVTISESLVELTRKGKGYISNICLFLMPDEERAVVEEKSEILRMV